MLYRDLGPDIIANMDVEADEQDPAIVFEPFLMLDQGVNDVSFVVSAADESQRGEYVFVLYGTLQ